MLNHLHGRREHDAPAGSLQGWAGHYDRMTGLLFGGKEAAVRQEIVRMAGIQPGSRVLDVGCGTGTLTIAAARAAGPQGEVWGVDVAADMLARARQKAQAEGVKLELKDAGIQALPFEAGRFDAVLSSLMIHHIPGDDARRQGLAEVRRVLKPGGIFMVVEFKPPQGRLLKGLLRPLIGNAMLGIDNLRLVRMLEEAGYRVENLQGRSRFLIYLRARPV